MEGEANPARHMDPPGHQVAMANTASRGSRYIVGSGFHIWSVVSKGSQEGVVCQIRRTMGYRRLTVLSLSKASVRPHFDYCIWTRRPHLVRDRKLLEHVRLVLYSGLDT